MIGSLKRLIKASLPVRYLIHLQALQYRYLEPEISLLARLVDRQKCALDVGAHYGCYTYYFAKLCRHVHAYEPNPELAARLKAWVPPNVAVHQCALSDRNDGATLHVPCVRGAQESGLASLRPLADAERISVETRRLDDASHSNVGFIKIDVEGFERQVIEGGIQLLEREHPTLLVEIEQRHLSEDMSTVIDLIIDLGYEGYFLVGPQLIEIGNFSYDVHQKPYLADVEGGRANTSYINNFFFLAE